VTARDLQAQLTAADALFTQQKWDEAIAAYKGIVAKTPALSVVNLQIAASYRNKKDYDNAVAAYEALLATDPANQKATVGIAAVSMERGDAAKAEATLSAGRAECGGGPRRVLHPRGAQVVERRRRGGRTALRESGGRRPVVGQAALQARLDCDEERRQRPPPHVT
jgi:hypothetical protein